MKLWSVWLDYGATGEGRTLMARIAYAEDEHDALAGFGKAFDPYYARGAEAIQGVADNNVTRALFTAETLAWVRQHEGLANLDVLAKFHFNFA
jgi:hypothetical protein